MALDRDLFLVANDEDCFLSMYRRRGDPSPAGTFDVRKFLDLKKSQEPDIEGLTRIGMVVYAVCSHSRDKDRDKQKERHQLFALEWRPPRLLPLGRPYTDLLEDLEESPRLGDLGLGKEARKQGLINIEGLAATPEGELLIGFRSPLEKGQALLVPLRNPRQVVAGAAPRFGEAFRIPLDSRGIRGIEGHQGDYLLAGEDSRGLPALWLWSATSPPRRVPAGLPPSFNPEAVVLFEDTGLSEVHLLSDDGNRAAGNEDCKDLSETSQRRFRRIVLELPSLSERVP